MSKLSCYQKGCPFFEPEKCHTVFPSQGRAKLRVFCSAIAKKNTQLSPYLTQKPCKRFPINNVSFGQTTLTSKIRVLIWNFFTGASSRWSKSCWPPLRTGRHRSGNAIREPIHIWLPQYHILFYTRFRIYGPRWDQLKIDHIAEIQVKFWIYGQF